MQKLRFPLPLLFIGLLGIISGLIVGVPNAIWLGWLMASAGATWLAFLAWRLFIAAIKAEEDMQRQTEWVDALVTRQSRESNAIHAAQAEIVRQEAVQQQFLENLGHSLRTPLTSLTGYTHLLLEGSPHPEQLSYLEAIRTSASSMTHSIGQLLHFQRISSGREVPKARPFSLFELVERLEEALKSEIEEKALLWELQMDQDLPKSLMGFPETLYHILFILIHTAYLHTQKGRISLQITMTGQQTDTADIEIAVQDTGVGLPAHLVRKLSEASVTASNLTYDEIGMGFGLVNVMARLAKVELDVFNEAGVGTVVILRTRLRENVAEDAAGNKKSNVTLLAGKHILVVEDNPINQKLAGTLLRKWGASVDVAADGIEAVEKAREKIYDLVFMDIRMPRMNGLEATEAIRQLPGWSDIPILALTASTLDNHPDTLAQIGIDGLIQKPFKVPVLKATLENLLIQKAHPVD